MTHQTTPSFDIYLRRNSDGLVRIIHEDGEFDEGAEFQWMENNYSCDCNRHLFFQRASSEDDSGDKTCGETAYRVVKFVLSNGEERKGDV